MGRPRKQQPTFTDALDVYLQTCTLDELESVEMQVSVWKRVRLRLEKAPVPPASNPKPKEQE